MKNWIRVALISFTLVGGTAFFAHQSLNQFDNALANLSASYIAIANTPPISFSDKTSGEQISTTTPETASTTTQEIASTTTLKIASASATSSATATDIKLSFVFPKKNEVYIGCTYKIPLQSSTTIQSLEAALVDSNTGETIGPIASGLAKVNKIKPDSQSLHWKVGVVWPGEYHILLSKINGVETGIKSKFFILYKIPEDISASERGKICKESGGSL